VSVVFRADDQPVATRAEYWHHVVADSVTPLDLAVPPASLDARDRLRVGSLGPVRIAELWTGATSHAVRRRRHLSSTEPELFKIDVQTRGVGVIDQAGRQERYNRGDFTLVDLSRPCSWANQPEAGLVAVTFPRQLLPLAADDLSRLTGLRVPGSQGTGALVSSLARQLPHRLDDLNPAEATSLGTTLLDLLSVALLARLGRSSEAPAPSRRRALVASIHAYVERHLADPNLSPAQVADAHYISVRYLHQLFEPEDTTVAGLIRRRRLDRCRRDLLDPDLHHLPVAAVGARWGLPTPAHFNRIFRTAYGITPGELRRTTWSPRPVNSGHQPTTRGHASSTATLTAPGSVEP
jgi:AraC-like DNA-binding protein